jgi:hypothetical protein
LNIHRRAERAHPGALNVGCTRDELLEIILQMAVYAGFPASLEVVKTAAAVFGENSSEKNRLTSFGPAHLSFERWTM